MEFYDFPKVFAILITDIQFYAHRAEFPRPTCFSDLEGTTEIPNVKFIWREGGV